MIEKGNKILITGSAGFIGTNLMKKCLSAGFKVDIFDLKNGKDIQNRSQLKQVIKKKYDIIFHLAGFSGSAPCNKEKLKGLKVNSLAAIELFELITNFSPRTKIILSSSRLEYGQPKYLPVDELHPTNPMSMYGLEKLLATQIALIYHKKFNLNVTIFRTSNVYGPHKNKKFKGYNLINHFIDLAKKNQSLTVFGDGCQKRDYIYVDDFTNAFKLAALSNKTSGQIYNLGFGKGIELRKMAELIIKMVGKGAINYVKWPNDYLLQETGDYISDIRKIKTDLGFEPMLSFEEGIARTLSED